MQDKFIKLTSAVYKVLEYFPESDPLKNRAKDKALAIMSALGGFASGGESSIQEDIDTLLGYLWIGKSQGWMNESNFLIISNEYENIKKLAQKPAKSVLNNEHISARQGKILEFLSKNEKAQVADLQTVLPNVTKRTIRRDLDDLLGANKVARFGEFNQVFYKIKAPA